MPLESLRKTRFFFEKEIQGMFREINRRSHLQYLTPGLRLCQAVQDTSLRQKIKLVDQCQSVTKEEPILQGAGGQGIVTM